jgi:hypothetical protein
LTPANKQNLLRIPNIFAAGESYKYICKYRARGVGSPLVHNAKKGDFFNQLKTLFAGTPRSCVQDYYDKHNQQQNQQQRKPRENQ